MWVGVLTRECLQYNVWYHWKLWIPNFCSRPQHKAHTVVTFTQIHILAEILHQCRFELLMCRQQSLGQWEVTESRLSQARLRNTLGTVGYSWKPCDCIEAITPASITSFCSACGYIGNLTNLVKDGIIISCSWKKHLSGVYVCVYIYIKLDHNYLLNVCMSVWR